jgi:hypothetical protein
VSLKSLNSYTNNIHFQAITAETVLLKFEKSRTQLQDSLRRVESIVTEDIGQKVCCAKLELAQLSCVSVFFPWTENPTLCISYLMVKQSSIILRYFLTS